MSLATLKATVAKMLEHPTQSDFVTNGTDLLLVAINNAKNWAQARYDFEMARTSVQLTINTQSGGDLGAALEVNTLRAVNVKKIEAGFLSYQGTINRPCRLSSKKGQVADAGRRYEGLPFAPAVASPLTAGTGGVSYQMPTLVQQNRTVFLYPNSTMLFPETTTILYMDVVEWLPDYVDVGNATVTGTTACDGTFVFYGAVINGHSSWVNIVTGHSLWYNASVGAWWITTLANTGNTSATARWALTSVSLSPAGTYTAAGVFSGSPVLTVATNAPSDFLLTYGFEFLMWRAIIEGNHLFEQFVFRQEGALQPPEKQAAAAWQALLDWDAGIIATNTSEFDLM